MSNFVFSASGIRSVGRSRVSALLVFCFVLSVLPAFAGKPPDRRQSPRRAAPEIKMAEVSAEHFGSGVRIEWRTALERGVLGFRVWREAGGARVAVNEDLVSGSIGKTRDAILPTGDEYFAYDPFGASGATYWVESVDASGSRWFGPVVAFEALADPGNESAKILAYAARSPQTQTERPAITFEAVPRSAVNAIRDLAGDGRAVKIEVRGRGIFRINATTLADFGFDPIRSDTLSLFAGGVEQPLKIAPDGSVEFFGAGVDTIQTDANVYWLVSGNEIGRRVADVSQPFIESARDGFSRVTVERRDRSMRISSAINGARENWFAGYVSTTLLSKSVTLHDIATDSGQTAAIGVDLQGISSGTHPISVSLNGAVIGQFSFTHYNRKEASFQVPLTALVDGTNTISLQSLGSTADYSLLEAVRVVYPRRLRAQGDRFEFAHESSSAVKLRGFSGSAVRVFDVTDPQQITAIYPETRLESDGSHTATIPGTASPRSMIAIVGDATEIGPGSMVRNKASNLMDPSNEARFIIISTEAMFKPLYDLRSLRESEGISTKLVDVEDVFDEFGNGVRSAEAIRDFLAYARQNWALPPDFVLLAGDSTSDPRNFSGLGGIGVNQVPTMFTDTWNIEAPTDEMLVDFNGDSIGEMSIGRMPAQTREELYQMTEKTMYSRPMQLSEISARGVHFVSDDNLGYNFASASRNMAASIPSQVAVGYVDRTTQDPATLRADIMGRINSGASIVNFFGHGSITSWTSAGILRNVDAAGLFNPKRTPFIVSLACLNGDSTVFGVNGFAESMMKRNQGGALAVWAASGWNGAMEEEMMGRDLYERVFAGMRLGDAVREVKSLYPTVDMRRTFIFYGDPTLRLIDRGN